MLNKVPKTEQEYFEAIQKLGDIKFKLKDILRGQGLSPEYINQVSTQLLKANDLQLEIIADLCQKFNIEHPDSKGTPDDKISYWAWYHSWRQRIILPRAHYFPA